MHVFTWRYWRYIFADNTGWENILCRLKGHPKGPIWFNVGGDEPNWKCRTCGEHLG